MEAAVRAEAVREDGSRYPNEQKQEVTTHLEAGEADRGLIALFWVHGWEGARREGKGMREALEAAATTTASGKGWEGLRRALGGELPRLTVAEKREERRQRDELKTAAEAARQGAVEAAHQAREETNTRKKAQHGGQPSKKDDSSSTEKKGQRGGQPSEKADPNKKTKDRDWRPTETGTAIRAAAEKIGVQVDAETRTVRKEYILTTMRQHPNKGGEGTEERKTLQEALELMLKHARSAADTRSGEGKGDAWGQGGEGRDHSQGARGDGKRT